MKPHEIQEKLGLTRIRDRNWYVQPACATTGDGLFEGLTWLTSNHKSWSYLLLGCLCFFVHCWFVHISWTTGGPINTLFSRGSPLQTQQGPTQQALPEAPYHLLGRSIQVRAHLPTWNTGMRNLWLTLVEAWRGRRCSCVQIKSLQQVLSSGDALQVVAIAKQGSSSTWKTHTGPVNHSVSWHVPSCLQSASSFNPPCFTIATTCAAAPKK